jgi:hypothetical protein
MARSVATQKARSEASRQNIKIRDIFTLRFALLSSLRSAIFRKFKLATYWSISLQGLKILNKIKQLLLGF